MLPPSQRSHLRFRRAAYLVLLLSLVPTWIIYWRVGESVAARDAVRFAEVSTDVRKMVEDSMERLVADLRALSGFFASKPTVSAEEWDRFLAMLEFGERHPGVRSVGFAEQVTADNRNQFLHSTRARLGPAYDIFPPSTNALAFPSVYVKQFPTNIDSRLGWDAYVDPGRRVVLDSILSSGASAASRKLSFWNKDSRETHGFTVFIPVHETNGTLRGVVFSSFVPQHLFDAVFQKYADAGVSVELFDGASADSSSLLASFGVSSDRSRQGFSESVVIRLMNRSYCLRVARLPAFTDALYDALPKLALAGGLIFSVLLFRITWRQLDARLNVERLNSRLRSSEEQLRAANEELQSRIAEAHLTEGLLAYERDLLRMLMDHSPDRIYFKDRDSRFIKCGRAVMQRLGVQSPGDCVGRGDGDFFTDEHAQPAFELEQEIIRTGKPVIGIVERETWKDGHESWVLTSKMPLRDKHGTVMGTFGISKDITELKAVELALQKEKELLAVTLRSIADGVITTDVGGKIVLFNQVAEQVTGWTQADATGRLLAEVFCTSTRAKGTGAPSSELPVPPDQILLATRDGRTKSISQSFAPIIGRDGRNMGAVVVFRDITDKLMTEAELLKASKLESIGVLAGGIAHDFNNILTVILGNITLARMAVASGRPIVHVLGEAEKASLRARELTHRLLTFAKGGAPIKKALEVTPLVRECAARALQGCALQPEFYIGEGIWRVGADESQIGQVVQNLIAFARSSVGQQSRLDIHVLNQEIGRDPLLLVNPGRYVRISIRDYGAGIQPEHLTKIFDPYFGSKNEGHGLELATAYSIVRKHDGQIRVESISGQGTVFHIYLPAAPDIAPSATAPRMAPAAPGIPRKILVMDDELPIRTLAAHLLDVIGHVTETAADGEEAIEIYEKARRDGQPFDAVIMDLTILNGMGGKETIRQLRQLDPTVRAIVSSGYSNDPVMAHFREHGFSGVVPKPYGIKELSGALEELFATGAELQN